MKDKIVDYIYEDYGVDLRKVKRAIIEALKSHQAHVVYNILFIIAVLFFAVLVAGAMTVLAIAHPVFMFTYFIVMLINVVYLLVRENLDDRYRII